MIFQIISVGTQQRLYASIGDARARLSGVARNDAGDREVRHLLASVVIVAS